MGSFVTGTDTIKITDSLGAIATLDVSVLRPLELFCDIIKNYMKLADDQVYLYNEKIAPITDSRMYIAVGINQDKYFGSSTKYVDGAGGMNEEQSINVMSNLSIDIVSRSDEARYRRSEIVLALSSKYSQNQQELNSFYIGVIPSGFNNLSHLEGAAIPFRFNITVNIQYFETKISPTAFFDVFQALDIKVNP